MSINEMDHKVSHYFDLLEQIEQLQMEAEAIKDTLKGQMLEQETEDLEGNGWRATWHNVHNCRFNSKRFKEDHPELYGHYMTSTTGTRFTLNRLEA